MAIRYGVGLGRAGFEWSGDAVIQWKQHWPKWTPPDEMVARHPKLEPYSAANGGMPGGLKSARRTRAVPVPERRRHALPAARLAGMEFDRQVGVVGLRAPDQPGRHRPLRPRAEQDAGDRHVRCRRRRIRRQCSSDGYVDPALQPPADDQTGWHRLPLRRRVRLPSIPRTSARPTDDPTERTTDLIAASATVWRPDARGRALSRAEAGDRPARAAARSVVARGRRRLLAACFCCSAAAVAAFGRASSAASRTPIRDRPSCRTGPTTGLSAITCWRSCGVIGPSREAGGRISVRWTIDGTPLSSSVETSASPTPSWVIALAQSKSGLGRNVSAAVAHRLLLARRIGAQRMLDAVAELGQHRFGHVERVLRDEIDADALGADQADHLLDAVDAAIFGASSNSRCASSKKNTSFGLSGSPTSGSSSNSSDISHSRKVA